MHGKTYDIKVCLKDIDQAIAEIYSFLPEQRNFLEYLPALEKQVKELLKEN
jgi:hypothetical protein